MGQAIASLRAEAERLLLSAEHIESIEAIAAEIREGAVILDDDKQAQRAIFQLLDVSVILNYDKKRTLG